MELMIFFCFIFAVLCAVIASNKNRIAIGWFFAGIFFGPLALIAIAFSPKRQDQDVMQELKRQRKDKGRA